MKYLILLLLSLPFFAKSQTLPSIEDKTRNAKSYPGFVKFYWDESAGKVWLEIDKFNSEILYQTSLPAGLGSNDIGLDRGLLGNTSIVKFVRVGNKILMVQPNYDFRAITNDAAERRAVEQSFTQSTLWGFTAEAESKGSILVDATAFLMRDAMRVANRLENNRQGNYSIDLSRSAMYMQGTKNFPQNSELETTMTFVIRDARPGDARPGNFVSSVAPSADAITLRVHHSFVQLPDNNYKPRLFDARSGFISTSYFDYSTPVSEPINKMFIIRHRLQKKDPMAAKSEAVKPIVYYLDNGTPEPIRSALLEGGQWWNQAFEAAGYINAFQVKILPEDADPMDIRYNMINWVHRSTRGWSYGAAVVDPRTGEIIKGNVTLGSLRVRHDYLIAQGLLAPFATDTPLGDGGPMLKMSLQRLKQLSAHEIGHTIGLQHNYISSTQGRGRESVMDYPHPVVSINSKGELDLTDAYTNEIGDWDKVAITYGYSDFPAGTDEAARLTTIITDAGKRGLTFISDRDARDPGGLHPTAHLWDVGKDPVTGLRDIMKVRQKALSQFGENNIVKGTPMAMLEDVLVPIYLFHRYQVEAVAKQVGGLNYSYALKGDGQMITQPLSKQQQLNALNAVVDCIDPKFLGLPEKIIRLIPPRPAGYGYSKELFSRRTGLAFDPLATAESAADLPLSFLFNPARLNRMVQYQADNNGLGIDEMINVLMERTWKAPRLAGLQGLILQQNEQLVLTYLLGVSLNENISFATNAAITKAIDDLKNYAQSKLASSPATTKGYFLLTLERIKNRLEAKPFVPQPVPPGAPIGCDMD